MREYKNADKKIDSSVASLCKKTKEKKGKKEEGLKKEALRIE